MIYEFSNISMSGKIPPTLVHVPPPHVSKASRPVRKSGKKFRWKLYVFAIFVASDSMWCYFCKKGATVTTLSRFGVSIDSSLLERFDHFTAKAGYVGRSEAFRDLIRARLIEEEIQNSDAEVFGVFTLVYNHHKRQLEERLTDVQHDHHDNVISTTHVHIDHDNCLEVILLRGKVSVLQHIAVSLSSLKGVQHTKLVLTSTQGTDHGHEDTHSHPH